MKKRIFPLLFILILLVPSAGLLIFGPSQAAANETLADTPSLTRSDGSFNTDITDEITDWMADHFALRQELVTAGRQLTALVFGESGEDDVILGSDGWLFYAETLDDYQAVNTMTDRGIWAAARCLSLIQEYCASKDVTFLFTVAPNKNSIYGEYMPFRIAAGDAAERNLSRLSSALESSGVLYVDLYSVLSEEDEILYRRGDSHWNTRGASLAGDTILAALDAEYEPFYTGSWYTVREEKGDLYEMVYPAGTDLDEDQRYDREFTFRYVNAIRSTGDNRILTASEGKSGSLVMYRDSFGNTLHAYLAEAFGSALFSRITPYDLTLLDSQSADTMIIELAERNLSWLNTYAAVMPAPEREAETVLRGADEDSWEAIVPADSSVSVSVTDSGSLPGCVVLTGDLAQLGPDADSPVYLQCADVLYEATPAGDGEVPFTAYIPEEMAGEELRLLFIKDGQYVLADTVR